jgi:hypothetical protein
LGPPYRRKLKNFSTVGVIALLVTRQYSSALRKAMVGQVEHAAQTIALDAADKILVNNLVALQRMLDQQIQSGGPGNQRPAHPGRDGRHSAGPASGHGALRPPGPDYP